MERLDPASIPLQRCRTDEEVGLAKTTFLIPAALGLLAVVALALWIGRGPDKPLTLRVPGTDQAPGGELGGNANPVLAGKLVRSDGQPANLPGRLASVSRAKP